MTAAPSATPPAISSAPLRWMTAALAVVLGFAGIVHCLLMPDHLARSTLLGLGFLAAGVAQFGLAALVLVRPHRVVYVAVIAVSAALMGLYAFNVVVGLPFHDSPPAIAVDGTSEHAGPDGHGEHAGPDGHGEHESAGLVIGAGEPIELWGLLTQLAELSAIVLAAMLLVRRQPRTHATELAA